MAFEDLSKKDLNSLYNISIEGNLDSAENTEAKLLSLITRGLWQDFSDDDKIAMMTICDYLRNWKTYLTSDNGPNCIKQKPMLNK